MKYFVFTALLISTMIVKGQGFTHTDLDLPVEDKSTKAVLTIPEGDGPFPAMVIIAGSGATDFDGNSAGMPGKNNSLKLLAESLAAKGYASIRYNKRIFAGFGEATLKFEDFVADAVSAYELLKNDARFSQLGIAGHSQGSLVGMLAAQQVQPDFYVSIAGSGKAFDAIISDQLHANPANPKDLIAKAESIMKDLKAGKEAKEVPPVLMSLFRPTVQAFIGSWMKYDPVVEIAKLSMPMVIINGTTDIQVSVENADMLLDAAKADKRKLIVEGMNHILKDAPEARMANLATYSNPDLPLSPTLVPLLIGSLDKMLKK